MCHHENDVMANIIKYYTLEVCSTKLIRFSTLFSMVNKMEVGAVTQEQILSMSNIGPNPFYASNDTIDCFFLIYFYTKTPCD